MVNRPKEKRNKKLVELYDLDPKRNSFSVLARRFGIARMTAYEIYIREKAKGGDVKAKKSQTVRRKYPGLSNSK